MWREVRLRIAAPAKALYDMVADVTRMGEWSPENQGAQWLGDATGPAVGARFKGRNRRKAAWSTTCVVTAADRGLEFAFDVGKGETRWQYRFAAVADGTDVVEAFEVVKPPGPIGRLLTRLGTGLPWSDREDDLERGMEETLAKLKVSAEGDSTGP